jgi:hypothetical protein
VYKKTLIILSLCHSDGRPTRLITLLGTIAGTRAS